MKLHFLRYLKQLALVFLLLVCVMLWNKTNLEIWSQDKKIQHWLSLLKDFRSWEDDTRERMRQRSAVLEEACQKYKEGHGLTKVVAMNRLLYGRNLLTCSNAKVGSQTMAQIFFKLHGINTLDIYGKLRREITAKDVIGPSTIKEILNGSSIFNGSEVITFVVVRDPLDRLISVYREKYYGGVPFLYKGIVYAFGALGETNNITFKRGEEYRVTFKQFINFITQKRDNEHWNPIHKLCAPCYNHYDFFLDLATFKDDLKYIYKQAGIDMSHENTSTNNSTRKAGSKLPVWDYFKEIPKPLLEKVYDIYRMDFKLFGYAIPDFMQEFEDKIEEKEDT